VAQDDNDQSALPENFLRVRGMRRIGTDPSAKNVRLSLEGEDGQEHWIEFPRESAGLMVTFILEAAKVAAERTGDPLPQLSQTEQKVISDGMRTTNFSVEVSLDGQRALLGLQTAAGLLFEFWISPEDIKSTRIGLRKAEEILNRRRSRGQRTH
jgi:hypothetical protein